jgi:hypothetical protein
MAFDPPPPEPPPAPRLSHEERQEQYRHECEMRLIEHLDVGKRIAYLDGRRKARGQTVVDRIMADMHPWCRQEITDELAHRQHEAQLTKILR